MITNAARRRGIGIEVIDAAVPIFVLKRGARAVRCYNALTDRVGAVSFQLANDKRLANQFLAKYGFPVPKQIKLGEFSAARIFLEQCKSVVVKPCREWGGRGISVAVKTAVDLRRAIARAKKFGEDVLLEQFVEGVDRRVIVVDGRFAAAIQRDPAFVIGNGRDAIRKLIRRKNTRARRADPGYKIPLDGETRRNLLSFGLDYDTIPRKGKKIQVRRTSNYHTGGVVTEITGTVGEDLVREARKISRLFGIPVLGVDFLVNAKTARHWVIEVSSDPAVSPPEGEKVARYFLDYLFPETARQKHPAVAAGAGGRGA